MSHVPRELAFDGTTLVITVEGEGRNGLQVKPKYFSLTAVTDRVAIISTSELDNTRNTSLNYIVFFLQDVADLNKSITSPSVK